MARQCFLITSKIKALVGIPPTKIFDQGPDDEIEKIQGESTKLLIIVPLDGDPKRIVQIGARLNTDLKKKLISFLQKNTDIFAWSASNMLEILADIIMHKLNIDPKYKPMK